MYRETPESKNDRERAKDITSDGEGFTGPRRSSAFRRSAGAVFHAEPPPLPSARHCCRDHSPLRLQSVDRGQRSLSRRFVRSEIDASAMYPGSLLSVLLFSASADYNYDHQPSFRAFEGLGTRPRCLILSPNDDGSILDVFFAVRGALRTATGRMTPASQGKPWTPRACLSMLTSPFGQFFAGMFDGSTEFVACHLAHPTGLAPCPRLRYAPRVANGWACLHAEGDSRSLDDVFVGFLVNIQQVTRYITVRPIYNRPQSLPIRSDLTRTSKKSLQHRKIEKKSFDRCSRSVRPHWPSSG